MLKQFIQGYWDGLTHLERGRILRLLGLSDAVQETQFKSLEYLHIKAITGYVVGELFDDIKEMIKQGWL